MPVDTRRPTLLSQHTHTHNLWRDLCNRQIRFVHFSDVQCRYCRLNWASPFQQPVRPSVGERAIDSRQQRTLSPNRLGRRFPFFFLFLSAGCMRSQCQMDQTQIEWRTRWRRQDGQTEKAINLRDLSESGEGVTERVRLDFRAQVPHENVEMFCNYKRKQKNIILCI